MPFHCDVCGSTLKGNYDKCPVCAKIDEAAKELLGEDANATMLTDHETSEISIAAVKDAEAQEKGQAIIKAAEEEGRGMVEKLTASAGANAESAVKGVLEHLQL